VARAHKLVAHRPDSRDLGRQSARVHKWHVRRRS